MLRDCSRTGPVRDPILDPDCESVFADYGLGKFGLDLTFDLDVRSGWLSGQAPCEEENSENTENHISVVLAAPCPSHLKKSKSVCRGSCVRELSAASC